MSQSPNIPRIALLFAIASIGAVAAFLAISERPATPVHATLLPEPKPLPDFSLTRDDGAAFTRADFEGGWHLVFFGFTHCPDICPATLQQLAVAARRVNESGREFPQILLVSVDPDRDTPARLAEYVGNFGAGIRGVTGNYEELDKLTAALGVFYARAGDATGNYGVDHSASVALIDESAAWHAVFGAPHEVQDFVDDIPVLTGQR